MVGKLDSVVSSFDIRTTTFEKNTVFALLEWTFNLIIDGAIELVRLLSAEMLGKEGRDGKEGNRGEERLVD